MVVTNREPMPIGVTAVGGHDEASVARGSRQSDASVAAADTRPAGRCPLCARVSSELDVFAFAARSHLPDDVRFDFCPDCNFIFAGDVSAASYRRYYASVLNDQDHVVHAGQPDSHVRLQTDHIAAALGARFAGDMLDVGCGQGRLLQAVARRFPQARLHGYDVADFLPSDADIRFLPTLDDVEVRFDVIVVSHVLEHLVDFGMLTTLKSLLAPGGRLYVEVPNPMAYRDCVRREFMYYFDRLHINHFGARAMRRLLSRHGLESTATGTHRFRYRDGHYRAMYHVAMRRADAHTDCGPRDRPLAEEADEDSLDEVYRAYKHDEATRARAFRHRLEAAGGAAGVLVYGAGDNFRRSLRPEGPLSAMPLLAVMDRRAAELRPERGIAWELPAIALSRFPTAPVVITVSQRAEEIAAAIRADWPTRQIFLA